MQRSEILTISQAHSVCSRHILFPRLGGFRQHSWTKPAAAQDSRYTLVRNHAANANHQRRTVTPAQRTVQAPRTAQQSSSRTVISKSNRTVISRADPDTSSRRVVVPGRYINSLRVCGWCSNPLEQKCIYRFCPKKKLSEDW